MLPVGIVTMNYNEANQINFSEKIKKAARFGKKSWLTLRNIGNTLFNVFMKPCSIQEQVEAGRLAEMRLRRHMNMM